MVCVPWSAGGRARPLARGRASLPPRAARGGGGERRAGREAPGSGWHPARARACVRGRWRPGRPGRRVCGVGDPPRWGGERERGVGREGVGLGREAPRLPHPARPVCPPHAPRPRGDTVSPPRVWPPARHRAAYPRPSWCAHPARLSPSRPPALPATWSLRGLGPRVPRGGGAELPPRAPPSPAPFTRPPVATARPPARSLRRVSGWGGGGGGGG